MTNFIIILTLSFSFLFGVDSPKSESQITTDIQFDVDAFQQNQLIKKGLQESYKQARKAKSIPKPAGSPIYISNQKSGKALKKETSAKKILGDEVHLEKRINAKQKLNELRAQSKAGNTTVIHDEMRKIKFNHQTSTRGRSRSIGTEFEFGTIDSLYEAFGYVLETEGSGCGGCSGNLDGMEEVASFPIIRQDSFIAWASDSGFTAFYFQFIDENETGEYDDGEIYAVSCEGSENSNNMTVAYNGSVYDLDFVGFWMEAYDFDWEFDDEDGNYSLSFDGVDDYAVISDASSHIANSNASLLGWFKINEFDALNPLIGFRNYPSDDCSMYAVMGTNGTIETMVYENLQSFIEGHNSNQWYHIALVYNGNTFKTYLDGDFAASIDAPSSIFNCTDIDLLFGGMQIGNFENLNGLIDDVSLWSIDLTEEQINTHMNTQLSGDEDGLEGYWNFNEGSGTNADDATSNGNNGTIYGATWSDDVPYDDDNEDENGMIEGMVYDNNGNPLSGASVIAYNANENIYVMTNETGYYNMSVTDTSIYRVYASSTDFWDADIYPVTVAAGNIVILDFNLMPEADYAWIIGLVQDDMGNLVSEAVVTITDIDDVDVFSQPSDWNGRFYAVVAPGTYNIHADGELLSGDITLVAEAGMQYDVSLVFEVDTTGGGDYFIEGIVRDFDGNPIPDVSVIAFVEGNSWATNSDEEGYYHIDNDSLNGMLGVYVSDTNGVYWSDLTMVDVSEGGNQLDFSLGLVEETTLLGVMAMTSNGDPVSFAEVHSPQSPQEMSYTEWGGWDYVTVYPSDNFADIFGYSEEYGEAYVQVDTIEAGMYYNVELIFGDDTTGGDYGVIYGSVQDMDGSRIPYAEVYAWNYDYSYAVTTDEVGDFFMEVPAGYYDMEAWAPGYFSEMNWVEVYPNEYSWVEFWLYPEDDYNTVVHGHVHDVDGNPLSFANVNANYLYDEWESEGTFTNEDGYYELYLRDDAYRITAGAEGFWVSAYDSIYVGGDSLWLDFELSSVGEFDGGWQGNVNLVGNHDPELIYLAIMSPDYQVFRILYEPGPQDVELVNGSYHLIAGADGYQEVFIPNAINIENNVVNFDIHLIQEGLLLPPQIEFAGDVPNDQGRQIRLVWNPGVPGDWGYYEFFSIWRQVNEAPMALWDFVATVPWHGMEPYSAVVPTLGDSTDMGIYWSTFRVTGHTENPNEFYDSAPVSGYSIDNLHPGAPGGVQAFTGGEGILLTWDSSMDEDFGYHRIYRYDTDSGDPAMEFTTVDTFYVDNAAEGNYEYWITAVDLNGNESDPSIIVTVTLAIDNGLAVPIEFALQQNYPNPFNPSTQIQYALPTDANVTIAIYDLVGRQIRTLVNQQVTAGYHSTLWNATNNMGSPVSAGVYIYTITANDFRDVKKMILLK